MSEWVGGGSTHAINKKVLCVRLWKGTCFCRRVRKETLRVADEETKILRADLVQEGESMDKNRTCLVPGELEISRKKRKIQEVEERRTEPRESRAQQTWPRNLEKTESAEAGKNI